MNNIIKIYKENNQKLINLKNIIKPIFQSFEFFFFHYFLDKHMKFNMNYKVAGLLRL